MPFISVLDIVIVQLTEVIMKSIMGENNQNTGTEGVNYFPFHMTDF